MGEDKPKIRWQTVMLAVIWTIVLVAMARIAPAFADMYEEMGFGSEALPLPSITSAIVGIPAAGWVALALAGAAAIIGKSFVVPVRTAGLADTISFVGFFLVMAAIVIALLLPLTEFTNPLGR